MKHIHLIGIGGTGISSIARVLLEKGYIVSGSDRLLSTLALDLRESGATVFEGHAASNIEGADIVVRSSAVPDDNPEVEAARAAGIPVLKRSEFLGNLMSDHIGIAVAGTHGKTTTTTMMAWVLYRLDLDPSYIVGGVSKNLGNNAHAGLGKYFVVEADEYDHMFLGLHPRIEVITNVEYDHPDCYPTPADYRSAFDQFVSRLQTGGILVANYDDHSCSHLEKNLPAGTKMVTCGLRPGTDYRAENIRVNSIGGTTFEVLYRNPVGEADTLTTVSLQIPGEHNVRNALQIIAALHQLELPVREAAQSLAEFKGTGRRFDILGEINGITVIDDYAHHPTKIRATLEAARSRFPDRRLVAVWQPHTYSRTQTLAEQFIQSLSKADLVLVTEVYAAREKPDGFSSKELVDRMQNPQAVFTATISEASDFLINHLRPGDVLVVLSAGDADQICANVISHLNERKG